MSIEKTYMVVDLSGNPVELPSGRYYCYGCNKPRKVIPYPHTGTIEPCSCGCSTVYTG